jgi:putative MFS transporter
MAPLLPDEAHDTQRFRPAWLRWVPFLVAPPALTRRQWRVLGLIAVASLFDRYDVTLFALALPQIQAELGIAEGQVGLLGAIVYLGAFPALLLTMAADRWGRRRLLLWTIVAYTVCTGVTAWAPDGYTFVALQFCARVFITAEMTLATVVIAEEFDPAVRGWGIGAFSALASVGHGLAWLLFALVEVLPFGWRALYVIGLVPLGFMVFMRRTLPETPRFTRHQARQRQTGAAPSVLVPLGQLLRMYPGRLAALSAVVLLASMGSTPAGFFDPKYLQEAHAWQPWQVSLLGVGGGVLAITGYTVVGWLGDRWGRKLLTLLFLGTLPLVSMAFYNTAGMLLVPLWIAMNFIIMGVQLSLGAYSVELFPTSYRSTAAGAKMVVATCGAVLGFSGASWLYVLFGSHWSAISVLALVAGLAPVIVAWTFPETSQRTLEEIAPDRETV